MRTSRLCRAMLAVALATFSSSARAEDVTAGADELFQQGVRVMLAGQHAEACPLIAESYAMDPRPGALFTLAECELGLGALASAAAHYSDYLARFERMTPIEQRQQRGREQFARAELTKLLPKVPRLTIHVPWPRPPGLQVFRNHVPLGVASWGVALPVDPGQHEVRWEIGGVVRERLVRIAAGEARVVAIDFGVTPGPANTAAPTPASLSGDPAAQGRPRAATNAPALDRGLESPRSSISVPSAALLGFAVLSSAAGTTSLLIAKSKRDDIERDAADERPYDPDNGDWQTYNYAGLVLIGTGIASAAAGVWLQIQTSRERSVVRVGGSVARGSQLVVQGNF